MKLKLFKHSLEPHTTQIKPHFKYYNIRNIYYKIVNFLLTNNKNSNIIAIVNKKILTNDYNLEDIYKWILTNF